MVRGAAVEARRSRCDSSRADNSAGCFSCDEDVTSIALLAGIPRPLCWRDVSASPSRAGIWTRPFAPLSFDRLFDCRPLAELFEKNSRV